jgi:hypothetical protein
VECRRKEHIRALKYGNVDISAVAEHSIEHGRQVLFEETEIVHAENRMHNRLVLESLEIKLNENKTNKENCFVLSDSWKILLRSVTASRRTQLSGKC